MPVTVERVSDTHLIVSVGENTAEAKRQAGIAEAAADAASESAALVNASQTADESGYSYAITDEDNRVALGIGSDGHITAKLSVRSEVPTEALAAEARERLLPDGVVAEEIPSETGFALAVVDADGRAMGFKLDGTVVGKVEQALDVKNSAGATIPLVSGWDIVCWGDSMTGGAYGFDYPTKLRLLMPDRIITNKGFGGRTSQHIAARQGGIPTTVTVSGNAIPASGAVTVTAISPEILWSPNTSGSSSVTGTLAGVAGTLTADHTPVPDTYTFTRTASGAAVPCPPGTVFYPDDATTFEAHTAIIWSGRNNSGSLATVRNNIVGMVDRLTPRIKNYLVVSVCNGAGETTGTGAHTAITKLNRELSRTFGSHYVDLRSWLIEHGLTEAGITPTTADNTAIAGDTIPPSLLMDSVHGNEAFQTVAAAFLHRNLVTRGY